MKSRLYILMILALVSLFALGSCAVGHIEDQNGEDTSVVTITDKDIAEGRSYSATLSSKGQANGSYSFNVQRLSGVYSLNKHRADGDSITFNMSSTLVSGNLRICIVKDDKIVADIPIGENQTVTVADGSGLYEIKLAAESAQISIDYTVE